MKIQPRCNPFLPVIVVLVTISLPVSAQEEGKQTLFTNVNVFEAHRTGSPCVRTCW